MIQLRQLRVPALMALLALGSLRCSDKTEPPQPSTIEKMDGDQQTAPVGTVLPTPLVVLVLDDQGDPVQGVSVSWSTQSGGSLSSPTSTTASNGRATIQWVLGSELGQQTATATVSGLQGSPVAFTATATDSDAPKLVVDQQPSAAAQSGVVFAIQPIIQLQDANGSDLAQQGVEVTASLASGSGTLGGDVTQSTDATGKATFTDLAITGTGSFTLAFSAVATTPGVSSAIVLGAAPAGISITTNPPVSALTSEVFDPTAQPVVHVTDQVGNPVAGTPVTASIATGSGTLEGGATATTDANGVAAFGDLGISGTGEHTILFTSGPATVTSSPVTLSPLSNKAAMGEWGPVVDWAIVPLHMGLLPNGKIFAWGKTESPADTIGMPRIWDPAAGPPSSAQKIVVPDMLFCAGLSLIPDGRLMLAGGHHMDAAGIKATYFFDQNGSFVKGDNMHHGRWYPTLTVLGDGRILSMAGRDETKTVVRTPEILKAIPGWSCPARVARDTVLSAELR